MALTEEDKKVAKEMQRLHAAMKEAGLAVEDAEKTLAAAGTKDKKSASKADAGEKPANTQEHAEKVLKETSSNVTEEPAQGGGEKEGDAFDRAAGWLLRLGKG